MPSNMRLISVLPIIKITPKRTRSLIPLPLPPLPADQSIIACKHMLNVFTAFTFPHNTCILVLPRVANSSSSLSPFLSLGWAKSICGSGKLVCVGGWEIH